MPTQKTVSQILDIANVSEGLAGNAIARGGVFVDGRNATLPRKIYMVKKNVQFGFDNLGEGAAAENATATITITDVGDDGEGIEVLVEDPVLGEISLGVYEKQTSDTTPTIMATNATTEFNGNAYGYTFTSVGAIITLTARLWLGDTINGSNRLTVNIVGNFMLINDTDYFLINSSDKFVI